MLGIDVVRRSRLQGLLGRISDGVAADIDQVKSTSKNIGEGSSHIQSKANELENLATELNRLVGQFKL